MAGNDVLVVEVLGRDECLALLGAHRLGRVAVTVSGDGPLVVPVNYAVDGRRILFWSGFGSKLRLLPAAPISFQVDAADEHRRVAWSVLVRGRAREIPRREAGDRLPEPWIPEGKPYLVAMDIERITGRRLRPRI